MRRLMHWQENPVMNSRRYIIDLHRRFRKAIANGLAMKSDAIGVIRTWPPLGLIRRL
jgi:hypothetical protein